MRALYFLILVAFVGIIVAFAFFNREEVTVRLFDWSLSASLAAVAGASYLLGMLSGWSVVGMLRRSVEHVTAPRRDQARSH